MTATCQTGDCPEQGIGKTVTITLDEGDVIHCGHCGHPCDLTGDPDPD